MRQSARARAWTVQEHRPMSNYPKQPQIKFAEMREYISASGKPYLTGYLGRTKLILFRDDNAEISGNEVAKWSLFIEEAPARDRDGAGQKTAFGSRPAAPREPRGSSPDARASRALRERGLHPDGAVVDDPELGL